jgi:ADP-heptose:LPS heptosyltransferase
MNELSNLKVKRIAIFRALQLGDMLCAIPAIRALKQAIPGSEITLLGMPWAESFVKRFPAYFSGFIHFPGYPGLAEQSFEMEKFIAFLNRMNKEQFDLIIQMHGNGSIINPMIAMLGARYVAGYCQDGRFCPDEKLFMTYPEGLPEVERHMRLMQFLGVPAEESHLEFPISGEDEQSFSELCRHTELRPQEYVCVHPGARDERRMWPPDKFAHIADAIAGKGYRIVLTGTEADRKAINAVEKYMRHPAVNCAEKTSVGALAALIKNAKMLFSNDTGVSHIASAVKTPSVVIFLASDPLRWAPLDKSLHRIILPAEAENINHVLLSAEQVLMN